MPILLSLGAVGESLHLLTLTRYTSERRHGGTHTLCYLKAICIADLLSIVTLVPFVYRHITAEDQQHYEYLGACWLIASAKLPLQRLDLFTRFLLRALRTAADKRTTRRRHIAHRRVECRSLLRAINTHCTTL